MRTSCWSPTRIWMPILSGAGSASASNCPASGATAVGSSRSRKSTAQANMLVGCRPWSEWSEAQLLSKSMAQADMLLGCRPWSDGSAGQPLTRLATCCWGAGPGAKVQLFSQWRVPAARRCLRCRARLKLIQAHRALLLQGWLAHHAEQLRLVVLVVQQRGHVALVRCHDQRRVVWSNASNVLRNKRRGSWRWAVVMPLTRHTFKHLMLSAPRRLKLCHAAVC